MDVGIGVEDEATPRPVGLSQLAFCLQPDQGGFCVGQELAKGLALVQAHLHLPLASALVYLAGLAALASPQGQAS